MMEDFALLDILLSDFLTSEEEGLENDETNMIDVSPMNRNLPTEILKKILENLDYKSIHSARQTCKRWKEIIYKFKLVEKISSKFVNYLYLYKSFECN